jgi:penicillin-binding protein 1A
MDAPLEIDTGSVWKPENHEGKFYGPSTLRFGIERSRNVMTVGSGHRQADGEYAKRMGVHDTLPPDVVALGAGKPRSADGRRLCQVRQWRQEGAASLIDRIQDRYGHRLQARPARLPRLQCGRSG